MSGGGRGKGHIRITYQYMQRRGTGTGSKTGSSGQGVRGRRDREEAHAYVWIAASWSSYHHRDHHAVPRSRRDAEEVRELHEGQAPTGEAGSSNLLSKEVESPSPEWPSG